MIKKYLLIIILVLNVFVSNAQITKKVLFLGNSYTYYYNLPEIIEQLALCNGDNLIHDKNTPGGYMLVQHAANETSVNKIRSDDWNHVILQGHSLTAAYNYSEFYDGVEQLIQIINEDNPSLNKTILFMTWGRENHIDYPYYDHQQKTTNAYNTVADIFNAEVSPVGAAWKKVRDDGDTVDLYYPDGSHPSYYGSYLAACVFYATIFDKSPVGLSYTGQLSSSDASYLQNIAYETYNEYVNLGFIQLDTSLILPEFNLAKDIVCFPIPTQNQINVGLHRTFSKINAKILDSTGKVLLETNMKNKNAFQLQLKNLSPGVYFLNLIIDGYPVAKKLIKV